MSNLLQKASIVTTPTSYENGKILSVKPVQTYGPELVTSLDFTSGWVSFQATIINATSFSGYNNSGIYKSILVNGNTYKMVVSGNANSTNGTAIADFPETQNYANLANGTFSQTFYFKANGTNLFLSNNSFGTTTYNSISVKEVLNADFDFSRNSSATRVGSNGLIQDVASNLPRIDYTGGVGSWKFEPQSTNLIPYSENFSQSAWAKEDLTVTSNQTISPDGTLNADLLLPNTNNIDHSIYETTSTTTESFTVFLKSGGYNYAFLGKNNNLASDGAFFDLANGVVSQNTSTFSASIQDYGNGWFRCSLYGNFNTVYRIICPSENGQSFLFAGDGSKGIYSWGAQLEVGSYPTSYIRSNTGSATTRLADVANNAGSSDLINSTEGVLYAETKFLQNARIGITNTDDSDEVVIGLATGLGIFYRIRENTSNPITQFVGVSEFENNKIALKYKSTETSFFVNGFKLNTNSTSYTLNGLNELAFKSEGTNFYGNTKSLAVFKEALTDLELECLVSWMSFSDLGINFGYTVE